MTTWDEDTELRPGDRAVVTITVADGDAPAYLGAGQRFTLRGGGWLGERYLSWLLGYLP